MLNPAGLPREPVQTLGATSSARIARMVKDVVTETQNAGLTEIRMSPPAVLEATLAMRRFLFDAVYENNGDGRVHEGARHPERPVGEGPRAPRRVSRSSNHRPGGIDVAARDFLAGMTDRFAVALYERLFIPKPWVGPISWNQL